MALTGNGSELEKDTIIERLKKLENIIYNNKLYVKCSACNGNGYKYICADVGGYKKKCESCNNGYLEVKVKDDSK